MYEEAYAYERSFTERMQDAKDAIDPERFAYMKARVTWKHPPLIEWRSVLDVASEFGCTPRRVVALCRQKRFPGAGKHRGEWRIPARRQPDGTYKIELTPGRRGPKHRSSITPAPPF